MPPTDATIRSEAPHDVAHVRTVNERAFGRVDEAALVDALRGSAGAISLVAVLERRIVGHILFTPVTVEHLDREATAVGLGPMAVLPEWQRQGIGTRLVRTGLDRCRAQGHALVFVLGHPDYYPRFGFAPVATGGLRYEHAVAPEAFMGLELEAGALARARGMVCYRPEFAHV